MGDFLLKFSGGEIHDELIEYVSRQLKSSFDVEVEKDSGLLTVRLHRAELELEAHMKYRKKAKGVEDPKLFDVYLRDDFENIDSDDFFLPCEKAHVTQLALNKVHLCDDGIELLSRAEVYKSKHPKFGAPHHKKDSPIFLTLRQLGLLEIFAPLHNSAKNQVFRRPFWKPLYPVQKIRDYYGEEVAYYFAWMNHFTQWLIVPAIVGGGFYLSMLYTGMSVRALMCACS